MLTAISPWLLREKATKRPQKVAQSQFVIALNTTLCSLELTAALSALLPRTRDKSDANFGKHSVSLWCVPFVGAQLTILAVLLRTMDRSNAKLGKGAVLRWLALFRVGKLSMR